MHIRRCELPDLSSGMSQGVLQTIYSPGLLRNLHDWQTLPSDPYQMYVVDICNRWAMRPLERGPLAPSQTTKSKLFDLRANRVVTTMNQLAFHGLHVFPDHDEGHRSPLASICRELSPAQRQVLAGNTFHAQTFAAWAVFVLAHCERI